MIYIMRKEGMVEIELIAPIKQKEWGWPAAANFILGGAGAGFYIFTFLTMIFKNPNSALNYPLSYWMIGPVLVVTGFLCLIIDTGRPLRSFYIFRHFAKAWISKEILAFSFFAPAVIFDYFFPNLILKSCAVSSSLFFMVAQGFILYSSRAIPAWNLSIMPLFFLSSGFASGAGLTLILAASGRIVIEAGLVLLSLACVIWNLIVWLFYLRWFRAIYFQLAGETLCRPIKMFLAIVLGHVLPIVMLLLLQVQLLPEIGMMPQGVFAMISGLAIVTGVTVQKAGIVLLSGFTVKVTLRS